MSHKRKQAIGYLRTSSTANVGPDKDSERRQRIAIEAYAKRAGFVVVDWFYDAAVSGADQIDVRPGFSAMLARIAGDGVQTIIVETAQRFARDLMVQEVGFARLRDLGITLIAADSPSSFLDDGPTSKLIRQILGAVAEFDKAMTVAKLRGARQRKRAATGKCEGRKSYAERDPALIGRVADLAAQRPRLSLRAIADALAGDKVLSAASKPYTAAAIARMLPASDRRSIAA
jgi:DNA invertase Pin-like site-specific DNA recombinase